MKARKSALTPRVLDIVSGIVVLRDCLRVYASLNYDTTSRRCDRLTSFYSTWHPQLLDLSYDTSEKARNSQ